MRQFLKGWLGARKSIRGIKVLMLAGKSCLTFCDSMYCSLPGSSIHGISQARILEWVSISFSRGSSQLRDWTCVSCIGRQILYHWATREACCVRGCLCSKGRGNVKSHKRQPGKMGMNPNVKETLNYLLLWPESCAAMLLLPSSCVEALTHNLEIGPLGR